MKETFRPMKLSKANKEKLGTINGIISEYAADGYVMTLRQLYYQLVSRDIIPNKQNEYAKISKLLKEGRMSGVVDWDAIEDRLRVPHIPYWNTSPKEAIQDAIRQYRLDRQKGQENYIEVWVEKDALSGVLKRVTSKYHVRLLVNRGYGSVTAIHDAYERMRGKIESGKKCTILYLGDHDPSGMDMIRDIKDRITEMLITLNHFEYNYAEIEDHFEVKPIALTMDQIRQYNPPKNPAKLTDPRSKWYVKEFGFNSWEVDALDPKTLNALLTSEIEANIDMNKYYEMLAKERIDIEQLNLIVKDI